MEIDELQKKAKQGDAEAQYQLGTCYFKGIGVKVNKFKAASLFLQSAENNYAEAQFELGKCYMFTNKGTGYNLDESLKWIQCAAKNSLVKAQLYLGRNYECGGRPCGKRNYAESFKWYTLAAKQSSPEAYYNLAQLYEDGKGVEVDIQMALKLYHKAAELGDSCAQIKLANYYTTGEKVEQNFAEAIRWLHIAAENGDSQAQYLLGDSYRKGKIVSKNINKAILWLKRSLCDEEYSIEASYSLSMCYLAQGNYSEAITCLNETAKELKSDIEYPDVQFRLGQCYEFGLGVKCNLREAMKWYAKAACWNHVLAKKRVIAQYLKDKNLSDIDGDSICEEAIKWYEKGDDLSPKAVDSSDAAIALPKVINSTKQRDFNNLVEKEGSNSQIDILLQKLQSLTGLKDVKQEVSTLVNLLKLQSMRKQYGLPEIPMSRHLVFVGNPGTGKTTVARILAEIYHQLGILSKGQLIEVDRSGLVAGYVGQTALKTQEAIQSALGGILFVDEAYTLAKPETPNDFGQEAIDTILKAMEDHRDDFVVIVAGYPDLMKTFINSNPGLKSRFNKYIYFQDYNPEELLDIFKLQSKNAGLILEDGASEIIFDHLQNIYEHRDRNFANGRSVRNYFERVLSNQANRLAVQSVVSETDLITLSKDDVINAAADTTM